MFRRVLFRSDTYEKFIYVTFQLRLFLNDAIHELFNVKSGPPKIMSCNSHKSEMKILLVNIKTTEMLKNSFITPVSAKRQALNAKKTEHERGELNVKPLGPINVIDLLLLLRHVRGHPPLQGSG